MRSRISTTVALAALAPFVSAAVDISTVRLESSANIVPNKYIVELASVNDLAGSRAAKRAYSPHRELYKGLRKRGASWDVGEEYDEDGILVGAFLTLQDESDLTALADVEGVKAIHPVYVHDRPRPVEIHIPVGTDDAKLPPDTFSTHKMTGVDKLHAEGFLGANVTIGIIDTGIDWKHPTLGGGFGPGHKVVGGYDFVGDDYGVGDNPPIPDDDPLDQCAGHGTHVAGIIGADLDPVYNFTGVAPKANLRAYRVFGCKGGVGDDVLVQALIRAYKEGNDVITLSLGGARGWTSTVPAVVASRIAKAGRIVTIAAGNDGSYGSWYASSPGTAIDAFSVASVENTQTIVQTITLSNGHEPIGYSSFTPLKVPGTLPIYVTSTDTAVTDDACAPLPDSTPDLSKYLVLIKRGTCAFVQKLDNAAAKGMKYALFYDNIPGVNSGIAIGNYTAAIITQDDGKYLVGEVAAGREVLVTFPQTGGAKVINSAVGGLMSSFSTYGPVNDLFFKPSIAAPGGNILSTIPVPLGSYAIESGTSMATPFMAGSAALLLEAYGRKRSYYKSARGLFETTATPVPSTKTDGDPFQTLAQSGAGLVNVYNAIHYKTVVTPSELSLNDTAYAKMTHEITVTNNHDSAQLYTISHVPAGTAITMNGTAPFPGPVPLVKTYATMSTEADTLQLNPGETKKFSVTFSAPEGLDAKSFPVFSGNVFISGANETLSVSYLGVAAAMRDMQVLDNTSSYFNVPVPQLLTNDSQPQESARSYSFVESTKDWPTLVFRLLAGSPDVRVDLLRANTTDVFGSLAKFDYQSRNSNGDVKNNGYNTISWSQPTLANNTVVPNGSYQFKISALRITGNPNKAEDWDTWLSPVVLINKAPRGAASATASATASPASTSAALSTPSSPSTSSAMTTVADAVPTAP